jgi:hypothetical protein
MKPKETKYVEIGKLEFDPENPRLPKKVGREQEEMRDYLARGTGMLELMASIGSNGFFEGEALIACETPDTKKKGIYRVVEGNRRLAALQLLQNPELVNLHTILRIANEAIARPTSVPVAIFKEREDILAYLGFRHITGVKNWDSLAKARYMEQLFEKKTSQGGQPQDMYREVAKMIGSRPNYVRNTLVAFKLYLNIEQKDFYGIEKLQNGDFPLAFFSTALGYKNIKKFLEMKGEPISLGQDKLEVDEDRMEELVGWLFRPDNDGKTKIGESRDFKKLDDVVADEKALRAFQGGATLYIAHRTTHGAVVEFEEHLYEAERHLGEAISTVATVTDKLDERHYDVADRITKQATALTKFMKD